MAKNKTNQTDKSVAAFLDKVKDEVKRDDSYALIELFREITGFEAALWGPSIIGFGTHHYKYESGHEGDMPLACFSPRSTAIVVYRATGAGKQDALLAKLGKHKASKGCLYIKKLADVDLGILRKLVEAAVKNTKKAY